MARNGITDGQRLGTSPQLRAQRHHRAARQGFQHPVDQGSGEDGGQSTPTRLSTVSPSLASWRVPGRNSRLPPRGRRRRPFVFPAAPGRGSRGGVLSGPPFEGYRPDPCGNTLQGLNSSPWVLPSRPPGRGRPAAAGDGRGSVRKKRTFWLNSLAARNMTGSVFRICQKIRQKPPFHGHRPRPGNRLTGHPRGP